MKIEINKAYRTRDGRKATVTELSSPYFKGTVEGLYGVPEWDENGKWFFDDAPHGFDLVAEWQEPEDPFAPGALRPEPDRPDDGATHAFPHVHFDSRGFLDLKGGLSKRELFAAMAMQGICVSDPEMYGRSKPKDAAELAVDYADALIAALDKEK